MQNKTPYKVLIAFDSFKGSMDSKEACMAFKIGLERAFSRAGMTLQCKILPLSDGGDGLLLALENACAEYKAYCVDVSGPYMKEVEATYFLHRDKAVLEMAKSSGLMLVPKYMRRAINATSYGLGEMILNAYNKGARNIVLGVGGSASNDCGAGCLQALGIKFWDKNGNLIPKGIAGKDLHRVAKISGDIVLRDVNLHILCDVKNPLLGVEGATYVYGRQKGVLPGDLDFLEKNMTYFSSIVEQHCGVMPKTFSGMEGSGAAGGIVFALRSFCNARVYRGAEYVLDLIRAKEEICNADLVITGEGKLDFQSSFGKAPIAIALLANSLGKPTIGVAGTLGKGHDNLHELHLQAMFSLINAPMSLLKAMRNAKHLLSSLAEEIGGVLVLQK